MQQSSYLLLALNGGTVTAERTAVSPVTTTASLDRGPSTPLPLTAVTS